MLLFLSTFYKYVWTVVSVYILLDHLSQRGIAYDGEGDIL